MTGLMSDFSTSFRAVCKSVSVCRVVLCLGGSHELPQTHITDPTYRTPNPIPVPLPVLAPTLSTASPFEGNKNRTRQDIGSGHPDPICLPITERAHALVEPIRGLRQIIVIYVGCRRHCIYGAASKGRRGAGSGCKAVE